MTLPAEIEDEFFLPKKQIDIRERLKSIVTTANNLAVTNEGAFRQITALYAESKEWEKQIEFARKNANAPDQDRINARNDKAKELLTPLKQIQTIAKTKSAEYQDLLENAKREEEARIKEAVAFLDLNEMPYIPPVEKSHRGDGAMVYSRTVRKFRIVDPSQVPDEYWQINEEVISMKINLGVNQIPGIEIFEEKVTQLRTR